MGSSQADTGSRSSSAVFNDQPRASRKYDEEHALAVDTAPADSPGPGSPSQSILNAPRTPKERFLAQSRSKFPLLYDRITKVVYYIRGPRPKIDLPGVFCDRAFHWSAGLTQIRRPDTNIE